MTSLSRFVVLMLALPTVACGGVRTQMLVAPTELTTPREVVLRPVQMRSTDLRLDAIALNQRLKAFTVVELQGLLAKKKILATSRSSWTVDTALTLFSTDPSAGSETAPVSLQVTIELKDESGVRYAVTSDSSVTSLWTDDVAAIAQRAIHDTIADFGSRL